MAQPYYSRSYYYYSCTCSTDFIRPAVAVQLYHSYSGQSSKGANFETVENMFQSLYTHPNGVWVPRNTIYRYCTRCVALFRANQSMKSRIDGPLSTWNTRGGAAKVPWSIQVT